MRDPARLPVAAACIVLAALLAGEAVAQPRVCVRAMIDEPFVLPDGSLHAQGWLRICLDRDYSPVSGLHTIVAEDGTVRAFLSKRGDTEVRVALHPPRILFERAGGRPLSLLGYALPAAGTTEVYWIEAPSGRRPVPELLSATLGTR